LGCRGLAAVTATKALDPTLRRNALDAHVELSAAQAALYDWLAAQTRVAGPVRVANYPRALPPDCALAEFEAAFAHHVERGRAEARAAAGAQLDRIEQMLARHAQEREHWRSELQRQHERSLQLSQTIAAIEAQRDA